MDANDYEFINGALADIYQELANIKTILEDHQKQLDGLDNLITLIQDPRENSTLGNRIWRLENQLNPND